jgi:hypothetical protein
MRLTLRLCTSLIGSVAAVSLIFAYVQTRASTRGLSVKAASALILRSGR